MLQDVDEDPALMEGAIPNETDADEEFDIFNSEIEDPKDEIDSDGDSNASMCYL